MATKKPYAKKEIIILATIGIGNEKEIKEKLQKKLPEKLLQNL